MSHPPSNPDFDQDHYSALYMQKKLLTLLTRCDSLQKKMKDIKENHVTGVTHDVVTDALTDFPDDALLDRQLNSIRNKFEPYMKSDKQKEARIKRIADMATMDELHATIDALREAQYYREMAEEASKERTQSSTNEISEKKTLMDRLQQELGLNELQSLQLASDILLSMSPAAFQLQDHLKMMNDLTSSYDTKAMIMDIQMEPAKRDLEKTQAKGC